MAQANPGASVIPAVPGPSNSAAESNALSIQLKGTTYFFPGHNVATKRYNFAAATSTGIVWSPAPPMEGEGTDPAGIPLEPFTIYLSGPADNIEILSFRAAGGYFYSWGIEEQDKLYVSVSQRPDGDGSYEYEVYVYSFEQERKTQMKQFMLDTHFIRKQAVDYGPYNL
ncbi:hypothetical protein [Paenibacillus sp. sgz500992]|uniref:hypothetical protein n=1 Tax=Paenibacillus sp. sgz500992 TaxID=3242476 RepID=UPI0036D3274E